MFGETRNEQGETHEGHLDRTAAEQVIYLDDNMMNLPYVPVLMERRYCVN